LISSRRFARRVVAVGAAAHQQLAEIARQRDLGFVVVGRGVL
jgi:hypothetical protein